MLGLAFTVGIVGGVYGIGGGSIMAPFLITIFKLPVYTIAGAVLLGTFSSSVAGVAFYSLISINGAVAPPDWIPGILFGAGGLPGMYFGAKMQKYVSEKWLKLFLGSIVLIIAAKYILIR
ncbi:MAG: TSUP family transporter [Desulfobacterales bacterium]